MAEIHGDFIKECVKKKIVKTDWVITTKNIADIMTKPSALDAHRKFRISIMNTKIEHKD